MKDNIKEGNSMVNEELEIKEKSIITFFLNIMGDHYKIEDKVEKLGGRNNNYRICTDQGDFVLRLPRKESKETVNRESELYNNKVAGEIGINSKTIYFNQNSGVKITEYIEDSETINKSSAKRQENMEQIAYALKVLHTSEKRFFQDFTPFNEMEDYIITVKKENENLFKNYTELQTILSFLKREIENVDMESVPCHLDALPENFIKGKNQVFLIDWEYSANYDGLWDVVSIGLECDYSKDEQLLFIYKYLGREPCKEEIRKMDLLSILMDILWSMWALSEVSLGEEDLYDYSLTRFNRGRRHYHNLNDKNKIESKRI